MSKPYPGVPGRALDDRTAGLDQAFFFGVLDDVEGRSVYGACEPMFSCNSVCGRWACGRGVGEGDGKPWIRERTFHRPPRVHELRLPIDIAPCLFAELVEADKGRVADGCSVQGN